MNIHNWAFVKGDRKSGSLHVETFWELEDMSNSLATHLKRGRKKKRSKHEVYITKKYLDKTIAKSCDFKLLDDVFSRWQLPLKGKNEPRS